MSVLTVSKTVLLESDVMPELVTLHAIWRYSHIMIGLIGLIVFWIPIFAKKGSSVW